MFDLDKWMEILMTMVKNPLRTVLTSLSVGVGIFILVSLLGIGNSMQSVMLEKFNDDAINSIWARKGKTSLPYKGLKPNRRIEYTNSDVQWTADNVQGVDAYSARVGLWNASFLWNSEQGSYGVRCIHPDYQVLEKTNVTSGRFINQGDLINRRKVALVGQTIIDEIFKDKDPVGEFVKVKGVTFRIIGTFNDEGGRWENRQVYVPITTGQSVFGYGERVDMFMFTTGDATVAESVDMEAQLDVYLKDTYKVHPEDNRAVYFKNNKVDFAEYESIFTGIELFIWALGFLTLLAGIIGVSNIMGIVVRERRKEIGVRKALGASPWSVVSLVLQESIFMTFTAGLLGLMAGVAFLNVLPFFIDHDFFKHPSIQLKACVWALALLTLSGAISGLIPALRAASIKPVEALRDE